MGPSLADDVLGAVGHRLAGAAAAGGGGGGSSPPVPSLSEAERLLRRFEAEVASGNPAASDRAGTARELRGELMEAWMGSVGGRVGLERAEEVLGRIARNFRGGRRGGRGVPPPVGSYLSVAGGWLRSGEEDGAERAASVLLSLTERPDIMAGGGGDAAAAAAAPLVGDSFRAVLAGLADAGTERSVGAAETVVRRMDELRDGGWGGMEAEGGVRGAVSVAAAAAPPAVPNVSAAASAAGDVRADDDDDGADAARPPPTDREGPPTTRAADAVAVGGDGDGPSPADEAALTRLRDLARSGSADSADEVESVYEGLIRGAAEGGTTGERSAASAAVASEAHGLMLDYYSRARPEGAAGAATRVLRRMDGPAAAAAASGGTAPPPPVSAFNAALRLWAESDDPRAPWRAREILGRVEELGGEGGARPDAETYSLVLGSWLGLSESERASFGGRFHVLVDRLLDALESSCTDDDAVVVDPAVLSASLSRSIEEMSTMDPSSGDAVRALLGRAEALGIGIDRDVRRTLLLSHANKMRGLSAARVLERMEREASRRRGGGGGDGAERGPDFACYEAVIQSLCRGRKKRRDVVDAAAGVFGRLLDRLGSGEDAVGVLGSRPPPPDRLATVARSALDALAKAGRVEEAEALLRRMEGMRASYGDGDGGGFPLSAGCFNVVLKAYAEGGDLTKLGETFDRLLAYRREGGGGSGLGPDRVSFGMYFYGLSMSRKRRSYEKILELFELQTRLYREGGGDETVKPGLPNFTCVVHVLKNIGGAESLGRAWDVIDTMDEMGVPPDALLLNNVLHFGMTVGGPDAARRAESILGRMISNLRDGTEGGATPDALSFDFALGAVSKGTHKAGESEYGRGEAARRALAYLDTMEGLGIAPNVYTYNHVLEACSRTTGSQDDKRAALELAIDAFGRLRRAGPDVKPNETTYRTLVKVYRTLIPSNRDDRNRLLESAFKMCRADGLVSDIVLRMFFATLTDKWYSRIVSDGLGPDGRVPEEWRRNVVEKRS